MTLFAGLVGEQSHGFGAVILAAGESRRMGTPKMLLPWGGKTVIEHTIGLWNDVGAKQIAVVWSEAQPAVGEVLAKLQSACFPIKNPYAGSEMWSSIQTAARWSGWDPSITHVAIVLGDQPHVSLSTLRTFLKSVVASETKQAWQPTVNGKRCHPVVLSHSLFLQIQNSSGPSFREFLDQQAAMTELVAMTDEAMLRDIDYPQDYTELARHVS